MASRRRRHRPRRIARAAKARAPKKTRVPKKVVARAARRSKAVAAAPEVVTPQPGPSRAEMLLLDLARSVGIRAAEANQVPDVTVMAETIAAAYAPEAPLSEALRDTVGDKTAQLALGWAREQVRLALMEIVESARAARVMRTDTDAETLAWLWLAACESLVHETPTAVADRVHALTAFLTARAR